MEACLSLGINNYELSYNRVLLHNTSWWQCCAKNSSKETVFFIEERGIRWTLMSISSNHMWTLEVHVEHKKEYLFMIFELLNDCLTFWCPNDLSDCKCQCWWHCSGAMMLTLMCWCHLQVGHPQRRLCPKISPFWLLVPEILPFLCPHVLIWITTYMYNMSVPTSCASMPATSAPINCQAPISVPLPTYDWNVADQMHKFRLFKCQLDTWFWLHKVKPEECLDYLLCILGKEGYAAMDHWFPTDEANKHDPEKFLNYLKSTLDDEISPWVCLCELKDIKKRSDESIDELIDRICQLAHCVQIGDGSNAAIEFEVQCRLIGAIPDANIGLQKELLKVSCKKKVSHLLEISHTYYAVKSGAAAMCAGKAIHTLHQAVSARKTSHKSLLHSAPTAPVHTLLAMTTALHRMSSARAVLKRPPECQVPQLWYCWPTPHQVWWSWEGPPSLMPWKGEESWCGTGKHWGSAPMWWAVCQCSQLWNCRKYSPRGDCGRQCPCPTVQWSIYNSITACKCQQ